MLGVEELTVHPPSRYIPDPFFCSRVGSPEARAGDSRYVFIKESDPGREIQVQTMLFDIPKG